MANRTPISLKELDVLLSAQKDTVQIIDYIIEDTFSVVLSDRAFKQCYFVNCIFERGLQITVSGKQKIIFIDSVIELYLALRGPDQAPVTAPYPELQIQTSHVERLVIKKTHFSHIHLIGCEFDDITIENSAVIGNTLSIDDCIIKDQLRLTKVDLTEGLCVDNLVCNGYCALKEIHTPDMDFLRTEFKDDLNILQCRCDLGFDRLLVGGNTHVKDSHTRNISIENSTFNKLIYFDFTNEWLVSSLLTDDRTQARWIFDDLSVLSSSFKGGFNFGLDWDEKQWLPIKEINLSCTSISNGDIFFNNLEIGDLKFRGMNKDGTFHFDDCILNDSLFFYQFTNQGKIIMNSMDWGKSAQLFFQNTILGPTHFTAVDFTKLIGFHFYESDISGISYSSVTWPDKIPVTAIRPSIYYKLYWQIYFYQHWLRYHWYNEPEKHENVVYYANKREMYRQLKSSAEKMHDRVQSLAFQRMEMKAYNKVLCLTKGMFNLERIILFLSRTNEYGQNWWRPIWLAALITFIFYIPIVIGIDPQLSLVHTTHAEENHSLFELFWRWHGIYPQLLNPVHSLERMVINPAAIHPSTWWLDYGHRIIMAFFIFQTISAFRKYVKS